MGDSQVGQVLFYLVAVLLKNIKKRNYRYPVLGLFMEGDEVYIIIIICIYNIYITVSPESFRQTTSIPLRRASGVPCHVATDPRPRSPLCSSGMWEIRVVYLRSRRTSRHSGTKSSLQSATITSVSRRLVVEHGGQGQSFLLLWAMNSKAEVSAFTASTVKRSLTWTPTWPWPWP